LWRPWDVPAKKFITDSSPVMTRVHQRRSYRRAMSGTRHEHHGDWYEIRIQGRLDDRWSTWLDDLDLSHADDGTTLLRGPVADQAALHGLLHKLRDLGVPLLSVIQADPDNPSPST
jgi:hypothetical protein